MGASAEIEQSNKARAHVFPAGTICLYCGKNVAAQGCNATQGLWRRYRSDKGGGAFATYEILMLPVPRCEMCKKIHGRGGTWSLVAWGVSFALISVALRPYLGWGLGGGLGFILGMIPALIVGNRMSSARGIRPDGKESSYADYPPIAARLAEGGWALSKAGADLFPKPRQT